MRRVRWSSLYAAVRPHLLAFQSCRKGQAITQTHAYWLSAHHRIYAILPPSPSDGSDIDGSSSVQLEAHVTRAVRTDRSWKGMGCGPSPRRQEFGRKLIASEKYNVHGLRLLPGGRWLLTQSQAGVRLWDLDSSDIEASMRLVCPRMRDTSRRVVVQNDTEGWDIDTSGAPHGFRIVLCSAVLRQVGPWRLVVACFRS